MGIESMLFQPELQSVSFAFLNLCEAIQPHLRSHLDEAEEDAESQFSRMQVMVQDNLKSMPLIAQYKGHPDWKAKVQKMTLKTVYALIRDLKAKGSQQCTATVLPKLEPIPLLVMAAGLV